jgi:hypothetical protein
MVSVWPSPKCLWLSSAGIGAFICPTVNVVSISRWWWPVFGFSTPAGPTPIPDGPNCNRNGLVTLAPSFRLMKETQCVKRAFSHR